MDVCIDCGVTHEPGLPHTYKYAHPDHIPRSLFDVVSEVPFVDPFDLPCPVPHTFSRATIRELQRTSSQPRCPLCSQVFTADQPRPSTISLRQLLADLQVHCPHCTTVLARGDLKDHLVRCARHPVHCPVCGAVAPRECFARHRCAGSSDPLGATAALTAALADCPHGCASFSESNAAEHAAVCPHAPAPCARCGAACVRSTLPHHQESVCPERLVRCPSVCGASLAARELADHRCDVVLKRAFDEMAARDAQRVRQYDNDLQRRRSAGSAVFKVITLGESGVGKTALLQRFARPDPRVKLSQFGLTATVRVDFNPVEVEVDTTTVAMEVWDTAGQERFRAMLTNYFRNADAIMLAFDYTSHLSLVAAERWLEEARATSADPLVLLVGCKSDQQNAPPAPVSRPTTGGAIVQHDRAVADEEATAMCARLGAVAVAKTSAATGAGVREAFETLARHLLDKNQFGGEESGRARPQVYQGNLQLTETKKADKCAC